MARCGQRRGVHRTIPGPVKGTNPALLLRVSRRDRTPLRVQLERELRRAVQSGRLAPGAALPATRVLAAELGVSRGLVVEAYEQLIAEGYLVARQGDATRVARLTGASSLMAAPPLEPTPVFRYDFRPGVPDASLFPARAWQRALLASLANYRAALDYPSPQGMLEARTALASYLNRSRATAAKASSIVMCTGFAQAARLVAEALAARGVRRLAVEDPGHAEQCADIRAAGLALVPIAVDADGLRVERLDAAGVDAVLVTPAHQYPTGSVLAPERRLGLLEWARRGDRWVLEDDYDAEYRYDREPVAALHGMAPDRVIYFGSASKMLAPSLRQGWVALPDPLVERVVQAKVSADRGSPVLEQLALAKFLEAGELDRHLRRTRSIYRQRRDRLVEELHRRMPEHPVLGIAAGLHLLLSLPDGLDETAVVRAAEAQGIRVYPASPYRFTTAAPPALLLGYGALPGPDIPAAVQALAHVIASTSS